ncbi:DUF2514 family protein [Plesiomonas shigelloides subsp. oncorhynchi]|nr:DUF2514 family protein [Plesiomonas shigelloides]
MISRRALFGVLMAFAALWCFSEWRYSAGEAATDKAWQSRWDDRDAADAEELKLRQDAAREEERRRTDAVSAMQKEANDELDQANRAAADAAAKSLGCSSNSKSSGLSSQPVAPARYPALPEQAKQKPLSLCSPSCSAKLMELRRNGSRS